MTLAWYDKVPNAVVNERTKLPDMPPLIADRRHSLFGHICRLPENTPASQALQLSIEAHTGTPPYLLVLPGSRARIVWCGGRYDPRLVAAVSEWVSAWHYIIVTLVCKYLNVGLVNAHQQWSTFWWTVLILVMYETSHLLLLLLKTYLIMSKHRTSLILLKKLVFISNFNVFVLMFVIYFLF